MDKTCDNLVKSRFIKYEKVSKAFEKFLYCDDITSKMDQKADKYLLTKMDEEKANKQDLASANTNINELNDRIKHLSVIQTKFATLLEPIRNTIH